jgi:predicted nuclease of predicted toxin-antitoxin system
VPIRFYLDENITQAVAELGRARGLDITSSVEIGRNGSDDESQLAYAASEDRCFVTADRKDFTRIGREWAAASRPHAGIVCLARPLQKQQGVRLAAELVKLNEQYPNGMPDYLVLYVSFRGT